VSRLRRMAQRAGLGEVVAMGGNLRIGPADLAESIQIRLQRLYAGSKYFTQTGVVSVPMKVINGEPLADADLIDWVAQLLVTVFGAEVVDPAPVPAE